MKVIPGQDNDEKPSQRGRKSLVSRIMGRRGLWHAARRPTVGNRTMTARNRRSALIELDFLHVLLLVHHGRRQLLKNLPNPSLLAPTSSHARPRGEKLTE